MMMMLKLLICLCAVSVARSQYTECGELQRLKVKSQWADVYGGSANREGLSVEVWEGFIEKQPEVVDRYYQRVRGDNTLSPEFRAHTARVMGGFDMTISFLDDPDTLAAQLEHLKTQHINLDVDAVYYDVFKSQLMKVVYSRIGRCFDKDAWNICTKLIMDGIKP